MAQTEKQLTEQLKAVENDIEAIDVQIASDPPQTSDLLLELREEQGMYCATAISLRAAIRIVETDHACNRDVGNWRSNGPEMLDPPDGSHSSR
jgi:hypothetical protein